MKIDFALCNFILSNCKCTYPVNVQWIRNETCFLGHVYELINFFPDMSALHNKKYLYYNIFLYKFNPRSVQNLSFVSKCPFQYSIWVSNPTQTQRSIVVGNTQFQCWTPRGHLRNSSPLIHLITIVQDTIGNLRIQISTVDTCWLGRVYAYHWS